MVISPLLKWYVEHGLKVTQIHQVVEYSPSACFQKFGDNISEARRAGDVDPEKINEIKDQGYHVKQMWECEWGRLKKQDPELKAFTTDRQRPFDGQFKMTEETPYRRHGREAVWCFGSRSSRPG